MTGLAFIGAFCLLAIGVCLYLPIGILSWLWLALQSPHQVIGVDFSFNLAIVLTCLVGLITNRKSASFWMDGSLFLMLLLVLHSALTTMLGFVPDYSYTYFDRLWKTVLLGVFIAVFMQSRVRIQAVVWVMAMSIAALALKGGVFSVVTAGQFRVWGPPGSQIADNNVFGAAICIALPYAIYLLSTTSDKRIVLGLKILVGVMPLAVLFTYSRGAVLTGTVVAGCYFLRARRKAPIVIAGLLCLFFIVPLMPAHWLDRMSTISETVKDSEKADGSVQGRFAAWQAYTRVALERPLIGGGFRAPEVVSVWRRYVPEGFLTQQGTGKAAHSNFFQVLGEHGFLGLAIYGGIILLAFKNVSAIMARTKHVPELQWARQLAIAQGITLVAYNVAGLTVSLPYYDYFIVLVVHIACLRRLVAKTLAEREGARSPAGAYGRGSYGVGPMSPAPAPNYTNRSAR